MTHPPDDPIMAELRAIRDAYAARFNNDPVALLKYIQTKEATSGREYITMPQTPMRKPAHLRACKRTAPTRDGDTSSV